MDLNHDKYCLSNSGPFMVRGEVWGVISFQHLVPGTQGCVESQSEFDVIVNIRALIWHNFFTEATHG